MPLNLLMSKREKDINGKYIGNAIGFCHCELHKGALNSELARKHKCIGKESTSASASIASTLRFMMQNPGSLN